MSTKIIAFVNFKGGVGKTANVVNLGACLARHYNKKILIIDLDAQSNATFWMLRRDTWSTLLTHPERTVCQIFDDFIYGTRLFNIESAILRDVPRTEQGISYITGLDLLPASHELLRVEDELHGQRLLKDYFKILGRGLKNHIYEYDYVFIDCPPNIYFITKNALYFADHYVIPYIPDYLSLSGFKIFSRLLKKFQTQIGAIRGNPLNPRVRAVIINRFKQIGNVFTISIKELMLQMRILKDEGLIHQEAVILEPYIRDCVAVADCSNEHVPVIINHERSIGAQDYAELSINFLRHFEVIS